MLHIEGWKRVVIWATCALGLLFALPNGFYGQVESYNDDQEAGQEAARGWGCRPLALTGSHWLGSPTP